MSVLSSPSDEFIGSSSELVSVSWLLVCVVPSGAGAFSLLFVLSTGAV